MCMCVSFNLLGQLSPPPADLLNAIHLCVTVHLVCAVLKSILYLMTIGVERDKGLLRYM